MDRFSLVIGSLIRTVVARSGSRVMTDAMIMLLSRRILVIGHHVRRLALAIRTGTLRTRRSPAPECTRRRGAPAALVLPRKYAWLVRLIGPDAVACGLYLRAVLDDPEMTALLAASPLLVRTLRPLCRMLAVEMPPAPDPTPPPAPPPLAPPPLAPPVDARLGKRGCRTEDRTGAGRARTAHSCAATASPVSKRRAEARRESHALFVAYR